MKRTLIITVLIIVEIVSLMITILAANLANISVGREAFEIRNHWFLYPIGKVLLSILIGTAISLAATGIYRLTMGLSGEKRRYRTQTIFIVQWAILFFICLSFVVLNVIYVLNMPLDN